MPILFTKAYQAAGKTYATLEEAQIAELDDLFAGKPTDPASLTIIRNIDKVLDILTTTENSRPLARKTNGGRKPRKPKTDAVPAELPIQ